MKRPVNDPMPIPKYVNPTAPEENPYWDSKTSVIVVKRRYRYPYTTAMNVERASTMGEKSSILKGRTMASLNMSRGERSEESLAVRSLLPVSWRSFLALRSRRVGG